MHGQIQGLKTREKEWKVMKVSEVDVNGRFVVNRQVASLPYVRVLGERRRCGFGRDFSQLRQKRHKE